MHINNIINKIVCQAIFKKNFIFYDIITLVVKLIEKVIRRIRKDKGYSQKELSNIIGVAQTTLSGYETNYSKPIFDTILDIANACDYDICLVHKKYKNKRIIIKKHNLP